MLKRVIRLIVAAVLSILILSTVGFLAWALWIPGPGSAALFSLVSDERVVVTNEPFLVFKPSNSDSTTGVIFYPGARVDPRAYAPIARKIAQKNYLVVVPSMPLNMALFAPNRAKEIIDAFPAVSSWVIGGHSMGGAFAAQFAHDNQAKISGLFLIGSYPPAGLDLRGSNFKVVSIYGSTDRIATPDEVLSSRPFLPASTEFVEANGGNHAQFGDYGTQMGDGQPYISADDQHRATATAVIALLERISAESRPK